MRPKTEELLYYLLWSADQLMRPTFRNLTESFEGWAYRNGLLRQIAELERRQFIERRSGKSSDRVCRLTEKGRLHALNGRHPGEQWARHWDGRWRLVLFDVPTKQNSQRQRLRRYLREGGFGYLQKSVWITPDPVTEEARLISSLKPDLGTLILVEGKPCSGEKDVDIVAAAWNFEAINELYRRHLRILSNKPTIRVKNTSGAQSLRRWAEAERAAWKRAVKLDPLLPERLLPPSYLGRRAWRQRIAVLTNARKDLDGFDNE